MPNIKSAIKRVSVIEKKTLQNNMVKTGYKTAVKAVQSAVDANKKEEAKKALKEAAKKIDQAMSKGAIKKNTASRKVSRLSKLVSSM